MAVDDHAEWKHYVHVQVGGGGQKHYEHVQVGVEGRRWSDGVMSGNLQVHAGGMLGGAPTSEPSWVKV